MSSRPIIVICGLLFALICDRPRAAEPDNDAPYWLPKLKPGENALVANRNAVMNKMAEHFDKRVTIVKFDDNLETRCPTVTSLFSSGGRRLEWLTPNYSLYDARIYLKGPSQDKSSANLVVEHADCRYVLTVSRYKRDEGAEKIVRVGDTPALDWGRFKPRAAKDGDEKFGFSAEVVPLVRPSQILTFTGIAFFSPTMLTINLANVEKDISMTSESNFLTHAYTVEIKNARAALRLSISKELYSNGQWVSAYDK